MFEALGRISTESKKMGVIGVFEGVGVFFLVRVLRAAVMVGV
jgi:hypothetical protein